MGMFDKVKKLAKDPAEAAEQGFTQPAQAVVDKAGVKWNPATTVMEEAKNPGSGISGAYHNAIGDTVHASQTSIADPLNKLGKKAEDIGQMLADQWHKSLNRVGAPGGLPDVTAPTVGANGLPAGTPGTGGGVGGAPAAPIAAHNVNVNGVAAGTIAAPNANDPFRNAQTALTSQLAAQANGTAPSLAERQMRQGQDANLAATMAQLASARGGANPLLQRQAMQTSADIQAKTAQDAATARLQEQMQAQGLLGQVAGAGRQGDVAAGQLQLQGQQTGLQGMELSLKEQQANQQASQMQGDLAAKYAAMGLDAQKANQQAALEVAKLQQQGVLGLGALQMQSGTAQNALIGQGLGALGSAAAYVASDARLKEDVKPADEKLDSFLSALTANDYKYKDEKFGKGRFVSPMAQQLEKSDIGKSMVVETPDGKMVDYGRAAGTILSAQSMLLKRVKELEAKKGKK